jgi:hypothetical protein
MVLCSLLKTNIGMYFTCFIFKNSIPVIQFKFVHCNVESSKKFKHSHIAELGFMRFSFHLYLLVNFLESTTISVN